MREATIATLCRGDATHVDGFLWPSVIGRHVGQVAERIGKNSLQEEFWREVDAAPRSRASDAVESFTLKLNEPVQVETSVFLHRLRVAGHPLRVLRGQAASASARSARRAGGGGRGGSTRSPA